nr:unnamed protein product [Callosobruchus analis]
MCKMSTEPEVCIPNTTKIPTLI